MIKLPLIGAFFALFNAIDIPDNNPPKHSVYSYNGKQNEEHNTIRSKQTNSMMTKMTGKSKAECRKIAKKYR